jgi:hypothetical protein
MAENKAIVPAVVLVVALGMAALGFLRWSQKKAQTPPPPPPPAGADPAPPPPQGKPVPPAGPQDAVVPADKANDASPILGAHASWPRAEALTPLPDEERPPELAAKARELTVDVKRWLSPAILPADLEHALGTDAAGQLYVKLARADGSASGLASRNRVADFYTLGFAVTFKEADKTLDLASLEKRLGLILTAEATDEIVRRKIRPNAAVSGPDDFAGIARLDPTGVGLVYPYFYVYAKPTAVVGVLQTIGIKKVK